MDISTFPNKLNQLGRVLYDLQMHLNITKMHFRNFSYDEKTCDSAIKSKANVFENYEVPVKVTFNVNFCTVAVAPI